MKLSLWLLNENFWYFLKLFVLLLPKKKCGISTFTWTNDANTTETCTGVICSSKNGLQKQSFTLKFISYSPIIIKYPNEYVTTITQQVKPFEINQNERKKVKLAQNYSVGILAPKWQFDTAFAGGRTFFTFFSSVQQHVDR